MASPSSSSSKKPVGKWKGSIASSDLRSFFVPAQKQKTAASVETKVDEVDSSSSQDTHTQPASASATTVLQDVQTSHDASTTSAKSLDLSESRPPSVEFSDEIDIGIFVGPGKKRPHDNKIVELLERSWKPPSDYKFPFSTHKKGGMDERRFVRKEHLEKYPWLVISPSCKGLFCKFCPFFAKSSAVSGKTYNMKTLVMEPLKKFAKLLGREGDLEHHQNTAYHKEAVLLAADFLENQKNREDQIANKLDNYRLEKIKENRETLKLILQNVIFLGRQNITFRGHRDDGPISIEEPPMRNEGNFRALLRFRCEVGDSALKTHLETASLRNKLTSKTVQNALIECCGQDILGTIVKRIKESEFFSVVFDETTDISHISQLSMVIRYVFDKDIREDFIGFLNVREAAVNLSIEKEDDFETDEEESVEGRGRDETNEAIEPSVTGIKLGQIVLDEICNLGLDLKKCVGIGTDGCSTNVSLAVGAIQEIQKVASNAVRCPCYNHNLNLIISKTTQVQAVRNAYGILSEVIAFFRASSKRNLVLKNVLGQQLKKLCETRWVERHDSVLQFVVNIEKISSALEEISGWENEDSSAQKAHSYMCSLRDGSFLVSLYSLSEILGVTCNLSKLLQTENLDIQSASDAVFAVKSVLEGKRRNVDHNFDDIFSKASSMIEILGGEIKVPRTAHRQTCRSNVPFQSAKEYFRQSVYIPLLDWVLDDFSTRFSEDVLDIYRVNLFLPQAIVAKSTVSVPSKDIDHDISIICKKYCELFGVHNEMLTLQLKAEYEQWQVKWNRDIENGKNIPLTTLDVYNQCHPILFPLIKRLLHVMLTLPVSIASAERSFSTLRTLKTYLRSRCGENRLNGLAMLYIHRDIIVDEENVINKFSMMKENRKHNFLL